MRPPWQAWKVALRPSTVNPLPTAAKLLQGTLLSSGAVLYGHHVFPMFRPGSFDPILCPAWTWLRPETFRELADQQGICFPSDDLRPRFSDLTNLVYNACVFRKTQHAESCGIFLTVGAVLWLEIVRDGCVTSSQRPLLSFGEADSAAWQTCSSCVRWTPMWCRQSRISSILSGT